MPQPRVKVDPLTSLHQEGQEDISHDTIHTLNVYRAQVSVSANRVTKNANDDGDCGADCDVKCWR